MLSESASLPQFCIKNFVSPNLGGRDAPMGCALVVVKLLVSYIGRIYKASRVTIMQQF